MKQAARKSGPCELFEKSYRKNSYFLLLHAAKPITPRPEPRRRREVGSADLVPPNP